MEKKYYPKVTFWLTAIGAFLSFCGILSASLFREYPALGDITKAIGAGLFLTGIIMKIQEIGQRLNELDAIPELSKLTRDLQEIKSWSLRQKLSRLHVHESYKVLNSIMTNYIQDHTDQLLKFTKKHTELSFEIKEHSPIHQFMYKLAESLPKGGVWLGVTLLSDPNTWNFPDFEHWKNTLRSRSKKGELFVYRIYYFEDENGLNRLKTEIQDEIQDGLIVRSLISKTPPEDISLLLVPNSELNLKNVKKENIFSLLEQKKFIPLCAIAYQVYKYATLTEISVYSGESDDFKKLCDRFHVHWDRSKQIPIDVEG